MKQTPDVFAPYVTKNRNKILIDYLWLQVLVRHGERTSKCASVMVRLGGDVTGMVGYDWIKGQEIK